VAPDERFIALLIPRPIGNQRRLLFIDPPGNPVQAFTVDQLTAHDLEAHTPFFPALTLLKWSDDGRTFWGAVNAGPRPWTIFKIDVGSWQAMAYDLSELSIPWEYDLNADMGMLVYSDCPQMYAADDVEALAKSQRQVSLFIYAPSVCSLSRPRA